ncbi:MAG: hypothetical protein M1814_002094 [Vezdaea aestivalis]|nr:MAG: hypothetical protein M1814_002094 [Vezdaea aestivalis]
MANYQQDARYQSQYDSSQNNSNPQYGARPPPPTGPLPRVPSFERDDDAAFINPPNGGHPNAPPVPGQQGSGNGYGLPPGQGQRPGGIYSSVSSAGYRNSYSPQSPPPSQQQFPPTPTQSGYNPQAYSGVSRAASAAPSYNPAAYQNTQDRRATQPAYGYGSAQNSYGASPTYAGSDSGPYQLNTSPRYTAPQNSYFNQQQAAGGAALPPAPVRSNTHYLPYQPSRYSGAPTNSSPYAPYSAQAPPPPPALPESEFESPYERVSPSGRSPASQQYYPSPSSDRVSHSPSVNSAVSPYSNDVRSNSSAFPPSPHQPPTTPLPTPPGPPPHQVPVRAATSSSQNPRPLPAPPMETYSSESSDDTRNGVLPSAEQEAQEALYRDVEQAVRGPSTLSGGQSSHPGYSNGASMPHGGPSQIASIEEDLDSDPEAAAGILAMQQDEEQSFLFGTSQLSSVPQHQMHPAELSSDSDYPPVGYDLGSYAPYQSGSQRPLPMPAGGIDWTSIPTDARVDRQGTGGFAEPGHERHQSFDADEDTYDDYRRSGSQSPVKDEYGYSMDSSSSTERTQHHSVPGLMPAGTYLGAVHSQSQHGHSAYPTDSNSYGSTLYPSGPAVPRSTSLNSHSSTPQNHPYVIRSKTDAEERELRRLSRLQQSRGNGLDTIPGSAVTGSIDLPSIPQGRRKRFDPEKMSTSQFKRCAEPWALSSIASWLKEMSDGETDLKEKIIVDGIVALFTHKVPTMNIADAETLAERVVQDMFSSSTLVREEEWVKFTAEPISGVLWQLAGLGCYAPRLHAQDDLHPPLNPGRCYAHHCSKTLKRINLQTSLLEPQRKKEDWATFYKLKKEDFGTKTKKDIECQNNLHEIVQGEDLFVDGMNVLRVLYRDALRSAAVVAPNRTDRFLREVFGKVDAVKKVNEDYLLQHMLIRQQEQGPWIVGFSDLFRNWIRKAKNVFIEYATGFPNAVFQVKKEAERNANFRQFLDQVRQNERSRRLDYSTFLKSPITRIQHYSLLLGVVEKNMIGDSEEKTNLHTAIEEIKAVTRECDARVAEQSRKIDLLELEKTLQMRNDAQKTALNLTHLGRELVYRGDLQKVGTTRFTAWVDVHAILFDHYLVLAKKNVKGDPMRGTKQESYDVTKPPIPMDLLVLESANDESVIKSTRLGATVTRSAASESRLGKTASNQSPGLERPGFLSHTTTSSSIASVSTTSSAKTMVTNTVLDPPKDEKVMFPFRVKHLGKSEGYTLYAPSSQNRQDWCDMIIQAKTKHAAALFQQNAEPFKLRVLADSAFADSAQSGARITPIRGTPLDRAIRDVENAFEGAPRPLPICKVPINCATAFNQPYGHKMVAIGTDIGVFVSEAQNPRGWSKTISINRVNQIAVLEEFSLFLVLAEKALIAYHLDVVCPVNGVPPANDSQRRAPQKLSGTKDVGFFATGKMKDRILVFYKKRDNINSVFKVLEPVWQKSTEKKSRFFRKGTTEFFREYDEFYIPTETYNIQLFNTSLAVGSAKGFEVLTLDKKMPSTLPDLTSTAVANIAAEIAGQVPLGMFRLHDQFLLCYERCAVYVDKYGEISTGTVMKYVGKANHAAVSGELVLLFDKDFVEIRDAQNGRLKQVISGGDIKCLDDGSNGRSIKISMQHPEQDRVQVVFELLPNEGRRDLE